MGPILKSSGATPPGSAAELNRGMLAYLYNVSLTLLVLSKKLRSHGRTYTGSLDCKCQNSLYWYLVNGRTYTGSLDCKCQNSLYWYLVNGRTYTGSLDVNVSSLYWYLVNGRTYTVSLDCKCQNSLYWYLVNGRTYTVSFDCKCQNHCTLQGSHVFRIRPSVSKKRKSGIACTLADGKQLKRSDRTRACQLGGPYRYSCYVHLPQISFFLWL